MSRPNYGPRTLSDSDHFTKVELSPIQNRLVEANLRRRHRFMNAQRHSHLLRSPTPKVSDLAPMQHFHNILAPIGTSLPLEDREILKEVKTGLERAPEAKTETMTASGTIASTPEPTFKGFSTKTKVARKSLVSQRSRQLHGIQGRRHRVLSSFRSSVHVVVKPFRQRRHRAVSSENIWQMIYVRTPVLSTIALPLSSFLLL
jgi:hypothetical protein